MTPRGSTKALHSMGNGDVGSSSGGKERARGGGGSVDAAGGSGSGGGEKVQVDICVILCGLNDFKKLWKGRTSTVSFLYTADFRKRAPPQKNHRNPLYLTLKWGLPHRVFVFIGLLFICSSTSYILNPPFHVLYMISPYVSTYPHGIITYGYA
jgi:hypothetical protein